MISVKLLYDRLNALYQKYQTGLDIVDDFNSRLTEVQNEVYGILSPLYQTNEKVRDILQPWRKLQSGTATNSSIVLPITAGSFDRVVSMGVTQTGVPTNILFEINPIIEGEIVMASRIPQRKPDFAGKKVYYLMQSQSTLADKDALTTITLLPLITTVDYILYYLVYPYEAKIAFTETQTDDEDILTYDPTNSVDLDWDMNAFNLILYKMLEKYGVAVREQLLQQYSQLELTEMLSMGGKQ